MLKLGAEIVPNAIKNIVKAVEQVERDKEKAVNTAIRITGIRLKRMMQREVRGGAPGGVPFTPLSYIARRLWSRGRGEKPLRVLAGGIRYDVPPVQPYTGAVGFVGPDSRDEAREARKVGLGRGIRPEQISSRLIRWLALIHQQGFVRNITPGFRRWIIRRGGQLGKVEGGNTPFFLRKETRVFRTPARPIIEPFWQKHQRDVRAEITRNFRKKMAGERI
jgi:hypothetical protein